MDKFFPQEVGKDDVLGLVDGRRACRDLRGCLRGGALAGDAPAGIRIAPHHNTNTGDGAGAIHLGGDEVLRQQVADLTARLERAEEEKARLLGIIETITGR